MPGGRPTDYNPDYCQVAIDLGAEGKTYTAIANNLCTSRETLYNWMDKHPEFLDAMKRSRALAMEKWEGILQAQALSGKGNPTAAIFAMKNQFPDDYRDRREHKVEAEVGVFEINFTGYDDDAEDES